MWSVVVGALAARRGQAGVVALVASLACAAVAAAGWYAVGAGQAVAAATVQGAPAEQRLVTATRTGAAPGSGTEVAAHFGPLAFQVVSGRQLAAELRADGAAPAHAVTLAHRDGVCTRLVVVGECPAAPGEVLLPGDLAAARGLAPGGRVRVAVAGAGPRWLAVVGTYRIADPYDPYWGDRQLTGAGGPQPAPEVVFTVPATLGHDPPRTTVSTHDLVVTPESVAAADDESLSRASARGLAELRRRGYTVTSSLPELVDRVVAERRDVTTGVLTAVVMLVVLAMFALTVVLRAAADHARQDSAWWRLRGARPGRAWAATLAPSVLPLLVGAVPGAVAGAVAGAGLAGAVAGGGPAGAGLAGGGPAGTGWRLAAGLVLVTVAGAVLAAVATQAATLRAPIQNLLRRVPPRRRWRRRLVDGAVVALVAAAVAQVLVAGPGASGGPGPAGAGPGVSGIGLAAPGLLGLALALVAGWSLAPLAGRAARAAVRHGRLATALTALAVARRTGTQRLFALAAAAVALLTVALVGADTAARAQQQRAAVQAGAARVLTVAPTDAGRLLAAVRAADPHGRDAMAVLRTPARPGSPPVLAVDTTRLSVVPGWRERYGGTVGSVAATLRPPAPPAVAVATGRLTIEAAGADPHGGPVHVRVLLRTTGTGEPVEAVAGPLTGARATGDLPVPECAGGCRLVGFELLGPAHGDGYAVAPDGSRVEVYRLSGTGTGAGAGSDAEAGAGSGAVGPAVLADAGRWRPGLGERQQGPVIDARGDRLRLVRADPTPPPAHEPPLLRRDDRAYLVDAPAPLPAVVAGWSPPPERAAQPRLPVLGGAAVPVRIPRQATLLPAVGPQGALVDLEYAHRSDPLAGAAGTAQVWLAPAAGAAVVDRLRAAGLDPVRQESLAQHVAALAGGGATAAARFQVAASLVVLVLAAGAVLARFAGARGDLRADRVALRAQGVAPRVVRAVRYAVPGAVTVAATAVGLGAGLAAVALARQRRTGFPAHAGFVDGWALLPLPPPHPYPVVVAALVSVVVLGGAAALAAVVAGRGSAA